MPAARSTSRALVLEETTAVRTPASRRCRTQRTEPGKASTPPAASARSTSACLRSATMRDLLVAGVQAACAKQVPRAVVPRLAVDVGDVVALDVERLLPMLGEQPVERPLPALGVQRRRRGQDAVEIEEHGVVVGEVRMRRMGHSPSLDDGARTDIRGAPASRARSGCGLRVAAPMCRRGGSSKLAHVPLPQRTHPAPPRRHRRRRLRRPAGGPRLRRAPVDVTLIDRRNFHLFQPLLYQVAAGAVSAAEIAQPLREHLPPPARTSASCSARSRGVDLERRRVLIDGAGGAPAAVPYDTLIVAAGSRYVYFGHDEWRPFAPEIKTLEDALEIRRRILRAFEAAELEHDPRGAPRG